MSVMLLIDFYILDKILNFKLNLPQKNANANQQQINSNQIRKDVQTNQTQIQKVQTNTIQQPYQQPKEYREQRKEQTNSFNNNNNEVIEKIQTINKPEPIVEQQNQNLNIQTVVKDEIQNEQDDFNYIDELADDYLEREKDIYNSDVYSANEELYNDEELQNIIEQKVKAVEIVTELEENSKLLEQIEMGETSKPKDFTLPPTTFFQAPKDFNQEINESEIDQKIEDLLDKLYKFKIDGDVIRTYTGPVVTTFEFKPAPHVKVSKILSLQDDLAMALKAQTIRIQAPVPGKDVVGIEIPNKTVQTIYLRELLESEIFQKSQSPLTLALGKDIVGNAFVTDLKRLPHLLIAGTTGSGKSVGINAMILSLLYKNSPENLKLIMIDPKMVEFSIYNDIPHLLTPVIIEPKQAISALSNLVAEMERRNKLMSQTKTKNIEGYNQKAEQHGYEKLPYIVVIIDELADLMMTSGKDVEYSIARLAQMARAGGIHLIVATQRPSVDVVTGLIKANFPSRLSYKVGQKIDSKVILDSFGAESLLGRGDMLFT
ncbi:MAG: DNA translocase FtsK, partial [Campylobacterales bacterium]|nr:DNA translocase FtsK [Campylobacterales bacterium]